MANSPLVNVLCRQKAEKLLAYTLSERFGFTPAEIVLILKSVFDKDVDPRLVSTWLCVVQKRVNTIMNKARESGPCAFWYRHSIHSMTSNLSMVFSLSMIIFRSVGPRTIQPSEAV